MKSEGTSREREERIQLRPPPSPPLPGRAAVHTPSPASTRTTHSRARPLPLTPHVSLSMPLTDMIHTYRCVGACVCTGPTPLSPAPSPDNWSSPPRPPRGPHPEKWTYIRKEGVPKEKDQSSRRERGEEHGTGHTRGSRRGGEEGAVVAATRRQNTGPHVSAGSQDAKAKKRKKKQNKTRKRGVWRASALTRPRATVHRARKGEEISEDVAAQQRNRVSATARQSVIVLSSDEFLWRPAGVLCDPWVTRWGGATPPVRHRRRSTAAGPRHAQRKTER